MPLRSVPQVALGALLVGAAHMVRPALALLLAGWCAVARADPDVYYALDSSLAEAANPALSASGPSAFAAGQVGTAATLDASTALLVPNAAISAIEGQAARTIAFWINAVPPAAADSVTQLLVYGGATGYFQLGLYNADTSEGTPVFSTSTTSNEQPTLGINVPYGSWYQLVATSTGSSTSFYVNVPGVGVQLALVSALPVDTAAGSALTIGGDYTPGSPRSQLEGARARASALARPPFRATAADRRARALAARRARRTLRADRRRDVCKRAAERKRGRGGHLVPRARPLRGRCHLLVRR